MIFFDGKINSGVFFNLLVTGESKSLSLPRGFPPAMETDINDEGKENSLCIRSGCVLYMKIINIILLGGYLLCTMRENKRYIYDELRGSSRQLRMYDCSFPRVANSLVPIWPQFFCVLTFTTYGAVLPMCDIAFSSHCIFSLTWYAFFFLIFEIFRMKIHFLVNSKDDWVKVSQKNIFV